MKVKKSTCLITALILTFSISFHTPVSAQYDFATSSDEESHFRVVAPDAALIENESETIPSDSLWPEENVLQLTTDTENLDPAVLAQTEQEVERLITESLASPSVDNVELGVLLAEVEMAAGEILANTSPEDAEDLRPLLDQGLAESYNYLALATEDASDPMLAAQPSETNEDDVVNPQDVLPKPIQADPNDPNGDGKLDDRDRQMLREEVRKEALRVSIEILMELYLRIHFPNTFKNVKSEDIRKIIRKHIKNKTEQELKKIEKNLLDQLLPDLAPPVAGPFIA